MKKILLFILVFSLFLISYGKADYSSEEKSAYTWAFNNGITTMPTIDKADMKGNVTRIALAKMISNYAVKTLKKKGDTTKKCVFTDVTSDLDKQYDKGVTNACQLGLMGQGITKFRPYDPVTRAEFGTILSRLLYGDKYNGGNPYYQNHLINLKNAGIMTNISNPDRKNESRGNVMIMLKRSKEGGVKTTTTSSTKIPSFDELDQKSTISCTYADDFDGEEYTTFLSKKTMLLPYKDGYFGFSYGGQEGYSFYVNYRLSSNMCDTYISSDSIFYMPAFLENGPYNKLYYHDGADYNYEDYSNKAVDIAKTLDCNPKDRKGCVKAAEKYMYNLLVGSETNEFFTLWMNELKRRIDNHQVKTVTKYYGYSYDERSSLHSQCYDETRDEFYSKNPDNGESSTEKGVCLNSAIDKYCRYKYINACTNGVDCNKIKSEFYSCKDS